MDKHKLFNGIWISIILVAVNTILFNVLLAPATSMRVDLTDGDVLSLTDVTERLLENLDEQVTITGYFSRGDSMPSELRPMVPEIINLLDEYDTVGGDYVVFEHIVPEEDPEAEREANDDYGISAQPFVFRDSRAEGVRSFYFAIVIEYGAARHEVVRLSDLVETSLFDQEGGQRLELKNVEFAVTRAIKRSIFGFEGQRDVFERFPYQAAVKTFISPADELPEILKKVPEETHEVLSELASNSGGKLTYERIDLPSKPEDRAALADQLGVGGIAFSREKEIYLWALLEIDGKKYQPLPLLDLDGPLGKFAIRETFEAVFKRLTPGVLRTVGVLQKTPPMDPMQMQMGGPPPPPPFAALSRRLREDYEVRDLSFDGLSEIPAEVDVLLVMGPRDVDEKAVYAIDQYVMRGGRLIICADRTNVEIADLGQLTATAASTGLEDLLAGWGVTLLDHATLDAAAGVFPWSTGPARPGRRPALRDFKWASLPVLGENGEGVNRDSAFLSGFELARLWFPSSLESKDVEGIESTWLLRSTDEAWTVSDRTRLAPDFRLHGELGYPSPDAAQRGRQVFATLLRGTFGSHYSDRDVPREDAEAKADDAAAESAAERPVLKAPLLSSPDTRIIIVANDDFVDELQAQIAGWGYPLAFFNENSRFVRNAVDWMIEDDDLLAIRNRGRSIRPLEPLDEDEQRSVRWLNFTIPVGLLAVLGIGLLAMRKAKRPLV